MRSQSSGHHDKEIINQLKKSNYYDILDLKKTASETQIKRSFKKMALKFHPDKNAASCSKQVFHKITEAYDTLSDPSKRNVYDEKQNFLNSQNNTNFSKANSFSSHSAFNNNFQKASFYQKKYSHWSSQFKMDQKARKERQWFRKQFNQKQRANSNKNQAFTNKADFKKSTNQHFTNPNEDEEQNFRSSSKKQNPFFNFQKNTFKKTTENTYSAEYNEIKKEIERKLRLQRQKERVNKNIRTFIIFVMVIIAWLTFSNLTPLMKGIPVYSMHRSQEYQIPQFTKQLKSPFYVTEDYLQRVKSDDRFRQYLDRKIDFMYIKTLSRVCNTMIQKQEELYNNLNIVKSKKSRKKIDHQLQSLDMSPCDELHDARERNPAYFRQLFTDAKNKWKV